MVAVVDDAIIVLDGALIHLNPTKRLSAMLRQGNLTLVGFSLVRIVGNRKGAV